MAKFFELVGNKVKIISDANFEGLIREGKVWYVDRGLFLDRQTEYQVYFHRGLFSQGTYLEVDTFVIYPERSTYKLCEDNRVGFITDRLDDFLKEVRK